MHDRAIDVRPSSPDTAYCRHEDKWYHYDDSKVTPIQNFEEVVVCLSMLQQGIVLAKCKYSLTDLFFLQTPVAYILFYEQQVTTTL